MGCTPPSHLQWFRSASSSYSGSHQGLGFPPVPVGHRIVGCSGLLLGAMDWQGIFRCQGLLSC